MFEPAERLKNVKVSASAAMTRKVRELRAQGVKIVGLSSGEPDFKSPANAIEAAHQAALAGDTKYPPQDGQLALKKAVQKKFKRDNNLDYALDEIMVSNGSKQIMFGATMASVNPGDEVIVPAPGWISYADQIKLCGGVPVPVSCPENNQFRLRARRPRGGDHGQDQVGRAELPQQSDRRGLHARRDERNRRRAGAASARAGDGRRDVRAPRL